MSKSQLSQPKLRFMGFDGEWTEIKEEPFIKNGNIISTSSTKVGMYTYFDRSREIKLIDTWKNNGEYLIFPSECNFYVNYFNGKFSHHSKTYRMRIENHSMKFIYYLITFKSKNIEKISYGSSVKRFSKNTIINCFKIVPSLPEQQKIAQFFSLLDHHIKLWERKLELCLLKKNYFLNKNINNKINNKKFIRFSDLLQESTNKVNSTNCLVCSVGKTGFQERKINISLNNKVQELKSTTYGDLCIGMGTTQIDFKMNNIKDKMCGISKAYKVFKTNFNYPLFLELYVNRYLDYFSKNYMIVSARQGKNVDLESFLNDGIYFNSLDSVEKIVNTYEKIKKCEICIKLNIEKLKDRKKYYLNNLFI